LKAHQRLKDTVLMTAGICSEMFRNYEAQLTDAYPFRASHPRKLWSHDTSNLNQCHSPKTNWLVIHSFRWMRGKDMRPELSLISEHFTTIPAVIRTVSFWGSWCAFKRLNFENFFEHRMHLNLGFSLLWCPIIVFNPLFQYHLNWTNSPIITSNNDWLIYLIANIIVSLLYVEFLSLLQFYCQNLSRQFIFNPGGDRNGIQIRNFWLRYGRVFIESILSLISWFDCYNYYCKNSKRIVN